MNVCLIAYACQPGSGSEPGVGWNTAVQLAARHRVWLVTRANNRGPIEAALHRDPIANLDVAYHEVEWALPFKRGRWAVYPYSYLWQASVHRAVARLGVAFDVAHQITFGSMRFPSSLHKAGVPYVLGPLGGGEEAPVTFWRGLGAAGATFEAIRWLSNRLSLADPLVRKGMKRAAVVIAASPDTARFLARTGRTDTVLVPSISVEPAGAAPIARGPGAGLRALYVGRLDVWKGVHLALAAIAAARRKGVDVSLSILGQGPGQDRLRRLARALEVGEHVTWLPRQASLEDVRRLYEGADLFLFPSLHDSGGMVVVEAMERGLPVICLDLGGPALSVDEASGFRVPARRPRQCIDDMAGAIAALVDPERRQAMGEAGRLRALETYTWGQRAAAFEALYHRAVNGGA